MIVDQNYISFVSDGMSIKASDSDRIYYAEVHEYFDSNTFRNFSVKMPLQGTVKYQSEEHYFELRPGSFLLSARQPGHVLIDAAEQVKTICIDISDQTIENAFALMQQTRQLMKASGRNIYPPRFFSIMPTRPITALVNTCSSWRGRSFANPNRLHR